MKGWPFAANASCVFAALFEAARPHTHRIAGGCLAPCDSYDDDDDDVDDVERFRGTVCRLKCMFKTVVEHMPIEETRAVLEAAIDDGDCAALERKDSVFATWLNQHSAAGNPSADFNLNMIGDDDDDGVEYVLRTDDRPAAARATRPADVEYVLEHDNARAVPRATRPAAPGGIEPATPTSTSRLALASQLGTLLTPKTPTPHHPRMGSGRLRTWLTMVSNRSAYCGWHARHDAAEQFFYTSTMHARILITARVVAVPVIPWQDWHTDGPAENVGRYHKIFVMVWKDKPRTRNATNVRLAHAGALAAHGACEPNLDRVQNWQHLLFERVACNIPMDAGDVLFFREDIWHRTQNMDEPRISLILDVLRFPLPSADRVITMPECDEAWHH